MASEGSSSQSTAKLEKARAGKKRSLSGGGGGGVRLSTDPQSVAARQRRHRISDRFKILQSLVPGGTKMDTVSMLEEAIQYVKFLKTQIWLHETMMPSDQAFYTHASDDPFLYNNLSATEYYSSLQSPSPASTTVDLPPLPPSYVRMEEEPVVPYFSNTTTCPF